MAASLEILVGLPDPRFLESQHLVVIGMGQLVQDDPGLLGDVPRSGQIGSLGNVNAFHQVGRVTVLLQPAALG